MTKQEEFKQTLNSNIDEDKAIVLPNPFNIRKEDCNKIIAKLDNKSIVVTEKILQDYTIIGNYVWDCLSSINKCLTYSIVGYIAQNIKFNSNAIKINIERLRGYTKREIDRRVYSSAMNVLLNFHIIKESEVKYIYNVNPLAIFKGNIYKFIEMCETYGLNTTINVNEKTCIDKFLVLKDKLAKDVQVVINRAYSNKTIKELAGYKVNFNKKF